MSSMDDMCPSGAFHARGLREYYESLSPERTVIAGAVAKQIGEAAARYMLLREGKATEHLRARALTRMMKLDGYYRAQNRGQE